MYKMKSSVSKKVGTVFVFLADLVVTSFFHRMDVE